MPENVFSKILIFVSQNSLKFKEIETSENRKKKKTSIAEKVLALVQERKHSINNNICTYQH